MKKKILLFGGSGLLGSNYIKRYGKKHTILATYLKNKPKFDKSLNIKLVKLNIKDNYSDLISKFNKFDPELILNFSGISDVEFCERNKTLCNLIIYQGLKKIVKISKFYKSYLIHISTDSLNNNNKKFNSEKNKLFSENYYSNLKIKSEKYLNENYNKFAIIRTRFFGYSMQNYKFNFFEQILDKLKKNRILYCYDNVFSTPISVQNLISILEKISETTYKINKNLNNNIFIYGKIDNNFHTLKEEYFHAIAISSIQELHRIIEKQKTKITELETTINMIRTHLNI